MRLRSWQIATTALLITCGGLASYAWWPADLPDEQARPAPAKSPILDSTPVDVIVVRPRDFVVRAEATGYLIPRRRSEISAETDGVVVERLVEEGARVKAGEVLLKIDDRLQTIRLEEARADLLRARAEYAVLTATDQIPASPDSVAMERMRSRVFEAEKQKQRGKISEDEIDDLRRTPETEWLLQGGSREAVRAVMSGVTHAENRFAQEQLRTQYSVVRSPFAGRIADLKVEVGQRIGIGQTVLTVLDDRRMKVEVAVLESEVVKMRKGATAIVRVPAIGNEEFDGTIYSVNPEINARLGTGRVVVDLPNPAGRLVAGLFATVELETDRFADRIVVPNRAVLVRQGRHIVFVVRDGRSMWTYVDIGARSGDEVEIVQGLESGDRVAVSGNFALAHGAPVAENVLN